MSVTELKEKLKYQKAYEIGVYNSPGPGQDLAGIAFESLGMKAGESIADYGCGLGYALGDFNDRGLQTVGCDIVNSMNRDISEFVPFRECTIWSLPQNWPVTDWAYSTAVLEHIPPQYIDQTLKGIAEHTTKGGLFQVSFKEAVLSKYVGSQLHLTIRPIDWWKQKISEYFENVEFFYKDSKRAPYYLFQSKVKSDAEFSVEWQRTPPRRTNKSLIIVGHGPSMKKSGLGKVIDTYDIVVRFAGMKGEDPEDFGVKTDYIVTSLRFHADIIIDGRKPNIGCIISTRPKQVTSVQARELIQGRLKGYNTFIGREIWPWQYRYQEMGATGYIDPKQGEPGMIPAFTAGTGAIIMMCHRVNPKKIKLAGFDNVWAGKSENFTEVRALLEGEKPRTSSHDIFTERKLITEIAKHYKVEIGPLENTVP